MLYPLFLAVLLVALSNDPIGESLRHFARVQTYRVTLRSVTDGKKQVINYSYKRPGFVKMEFVSPHTGALLVYNPEKNEARLRPFGIAPFFILTLNPDNPLIKSPTGHRVDRSDIGSLLNTIISLQKNGTTTVNSITTLNGRQAIEVTVVGQDVSAVDGVHSCHLWLDKTTMLPLKVITYSADHTMIEEVLMDNLEINVTFEAGEFNL
ncbi:MAG: DUF1571 domain-containing protein [Desulfuromonadales bacterium]|nr:MAG: DUF1571 domain-containing protein [Desulfuromonadales bacterium]